MAKVENWRRWIQPDAKKSVVIGAPTHKAVQKIAEETGMTMQFWSDALVRLALSHVRLERMVEAAKGVTQDAYTARVRAVDKMIYDLIEDGAVVTHAVAPVDEQEPPPPVAKEPEKLSKGAQLANGALRLAQARELRRQRRRQEMSQTGALGGR